MKTYFRFAVTLTWSKIIAFLALCFSVYLDKTIEDSDGRIFMYTLPFVVALVTGKQAIDKVLAKNPKDA